MTSLELLLLIAGVAALQLAIYLAIAFWRHWRAYLALRRRAANEILEPARERVSEVPPTAAGAMWQGLRTFRIVRKVIEDAAGTVCSFNLCPEDRRPLPPYWPGQFLTLSLDIPAVSGPALQVVRCYTLSDAPGQDTYRISVKRVAGGRASNFLHVRLDVGGSLKVRAPSGHFHIDQGEAPVVLIGGGIGITPMLAMLNWCLTNQPHREVWLFYGVRNAREAIMLPHLEKLAAAHTNLHLRLCYSAPQPEDLSRCLADPGGNPRGGHSIHHHRRIDITFLRLQLPLKPFQFYICGPAPMLESLVPALEDWGVPPERIHFEAFGPSSIKRHPRSQEEALSVLEGSAVTVTFAKSGKQISWQPAAGSLLEFAEANGVSVNSGCRAGGCGSCQTTIQTGEVSYRRVPDYDPNQAHASCACARLRPALPWRHRER